MKKPGLLLATLAAASLLNAQETRLVRFGLLTDTHVCDKGDQSRVITVNAAARHFTAGLATIEAFAGTMNAGQAAFVAELGNVADSPVDGSLGAEQRRAAAWTRPCRESPHRDVGRHVIDRMRRAFGRAPAAATGWGSTSIGAPPSPCTRSAPIGWIRQNGTTGSDSELVGYAAS
jgi:hypothetical protein